MKRVLKDNILSFYTTYQGKELLVFRHILNDKDDFESRTNKNCFYDYITTEKALFSTFIISTPTQLYVTHVSFPFGCAAIAPIVVLDEEKAVVAHQFGNLIFTTDTDNFLKIVPMFHKHMTDKAKEILALPIRNNIYLNDAPDKLEYDFSRASAFDHQLNTFRFNARLNEIEAEFCTPDYNRIVQKICNRYTPDEVVIRTYQNGLTIKYYPHLSTRLKQRAADTLRHPMTLCLISLLTLCCLFQKCSPDKEPYSRPKIPVLSQPPHRTSLPVSEREHF